MNFPAVKRNGENEVRIIREDGKTRLILNGADISSGCLGFDLKQNGADSPELNIVLSVKSLEISLEGVKADVKAKNPQSLMAKVAAKLKSAQKREAGSEFLPLGF